MNNNKSHNRIPAILATAALVLVSAFQLGCSSDSGPATTPAVSISNVSIAEGNDGTSNLVFTLSLTGNAGSSASVDYATSNGTATAGSDYTAVTTTTLHFTGTNTATISIEIHGDTTIEDDEIFTLTLSNPVGVTLTNTTAIGTITNDDNGGYFTGSVSLTAPVVTDPPTVISGLQAIFNNDEFVIASVANDLLYKGTITARTGIDYTATVRIYKTGVYVRSAAVTGEFTSGGLVNGTLSGTGEYTNGTFALTYSTLNTRAPLVFVVDDIWHVPIPFAVVVTFTTNTTADIELRAAASSDNFDSCDMTGVTLVNVNSEQIGRLRQFSGVLTGCSIYTVDTPPAPAQGYFTSFDYNGADSALFFVLFNDNDAQISILHCKNNECV